MKDKKSSQEIIDGSNELINHLEKVFGFDIKKCVVVSIGKDQICVYIQHHTMEKFLVKKVITEIETWEKIYDLPIQINKIGKIVLAGEKK